MVDGGLVFVAVPVWAVGPLVYVLVGAFITWRFMQYSGIPGIIDNPERPKPGWLIWLIVVLISLVMFLFWPGILAVFIGYINE